MNSFYTEEEISKLGFKSIGDNVKISRYAQFYYPDQIILGNNVRIDDFCILSGNIKIGNFVHISAYVALYGKAGIEINDYAGISAKTTLYSESDDFSGESLIGPFHPEGKRNLQCGKITVGKFAQIGCNCVIFPAVEISEGAVIGAMSLVKKTISPWTISAGIPAKFIKFRSKNMLKLL